MSFAAALMLGSFFLWAAMGMPIGFSMLASAFLYLLVSHQDIGLVASQSLNGLFRSFVLLAVPLFIVAAEIMNAGTISERLLSLVFVLAALSCRKRSISRSCSCTCSASAIILGCFGRR